MTEQHEFWPDGARLAVSVSVQFEAGGQPISGASGPITEPILDGFPDLGQNTFYEYGAREGVPRILDLLDQHQIKMTSFMIGDAVRRHPQVAAEIVRRGHEAGAHGRRWQRQYHLSRPQETEWIADTVQAIEQVTGTRPVGYNSYWIRPGVNTLEILQELGFTYHIDDLSADEPFLQLINGQPFAAVPYTVHLNDIASFDFPRLQPGRLRAAADRRVRPALRRGRGPPPDDGHRSARAHLRARLPGPRPRPDLHPAAQPRRVVGPQGPDRPVGPRPSRYRRLGGPGPGTGQRPAGTERLRPAA
jgi:peptidoglycan/xylan/chitin deacetylase (PgdA/CDA1 family)